MGVIETLSSGFGMVARRPWLMAVPVIFDLLLWLCPRIIAAPLVNKGLDWYDQVYTDSFSQLASNYGTAARNMEESYEQFRALAEQMGNSNLLGLAATPLVIEALDSPLPSLINITSVSPTAELFQRPVISVDSGGVLFFLWVGLGALGMMAAALYLGPIAQSIQSRSMGMEEFDKRLGTNWARLLSFLAFVLGLLLFIGIPMLLIVGIIGLWLPPLGSLLLTLVGAASLWAMLFLFFVNSAIFLGDLDVLKAIRSSFVTVRGNFWSVLFLFFLVIIIQWGTIFAWGLVLGHPLGMLVAILGNAYIATGLAASTLLFYRDRSGLVGETSASLIGARE